MTTLLRIAQDVRARDAVVDPNLGVAQAGEVFHSHVSASPIEAACLLMIESLDLETLMKVIPRRRFVGVDDRALAMRPRRNGAAWFSVLHTAGTELPPRSRITTKTLRFPMALKSDRIAAMPLADGRSWREAAVPERPTERCHQRTLDVAGTRPPPFIDPSQQCAPIALLFNKTLLASAAARELRSYSEP
jgi:hypothetical protein